MKSVVFICLLSLSLSLSQPTSQQATPDAHISNAVTTSVGTAEDVKSVDLKNATEQAKTPTILSNATETTPQVSPQTQMQNATTINNQIQTGKNESTTNEAGAKTTMKPEENKTDNEKKSETTPAGKQTEPTKDEKNATKKEDAEKKAADGTQGDAKKNETTTEKSQVVVTTEKPKNVQPVQSRAFDGPSFFGGMVLALGLLAIGFMGYKYYKNQTDGNYHTL